MSTYDPKCFCGWYVVYLWSKGPQRGNPCPMVAKSLLGPYSEEEAIWVASERSLRTDTIHTQVIEITL